LTELCEELSLDEIAGQGSGDLERLLRLTSRVRELAEHTEQHSSKQMSYGAPGDAFSILAGVRNGQTLQCHAYTLLLIQCLAALGYTARQSSCGYFTPREHVVVEVWSSEYSKWLMLDPDYDLLYVRGGLPLSVYEVQQVALELERGFREWVFDNSLHISCRSERDRLLARYAAENGDVLAGVEAIRGTAASPRIPQKMAESPTGICLEVHRSFAVSLRNDYLSRSYPVCHPRRFAQAAMAAGAARWMADYDGVLTDDLTDLYWTLNSVRMAFEATAEPGTILVRLRTFTPSFKSFHVVLDGRAVDTTEPLLRWRLGEGEHSIAVWAVNARGLEGARSSASFKLLRGV
jgi:hypothetical protein